MRKATTIRRRVTIGLDVSDRTSRACVVDARGQVEREDRLRTTPEAVGAWFAGYARARVVLEFAGPDLVTEFRSLLQHLSIERLS